MAHLSCNNSPPDHLRPAPLRIPHRKSMVSFDDEPEIAVIEHRDEVGDTSTSTSPRTGPTQRFKPDAPSAAPKNGQPRTKIGSLVSRFEVLDVLNRADSSMPRFLNGSDNARLSTIPRAIESMRTPKHGRADHSPIESTCRTSSEINPQQVQTPCTSTRRSMLPISKQRIRAHDTIDDNRNDAPCSSTNKASIHDNNIDADNQETPSLSSKLTSYTPSSSDSQRSG